MQCTINNVLLIQPVELLNGRTLHIKTSGSFMRKSEPFTVEGVVKWVVEEIGDVGGINVCKSNESPCEVARPSSSAKHAAKPGIVECLHFLPLKIVHQTEE